MYLLTVPNHSRRRLSLHETALSHKEMAAWPHTDIKIFQCVEAESKGTKEVLDNVAVNKDVPVPMSNAAESAVVESFDSAEGAGETSSIYRESRTAVTFQYSDMFSTNGESNSSTDNSFTGLPCLDNYTASETNSISRDMGAAVTF